MKKEELSEKLSDLVEEALSASEITLALVSILDSYKIANETMDSDRLSNAFCGVANMMKRISYDLDKLSIETIETA